jgi:hypothetical protein
MKKKHTTLTQMYIDMSIAESTLKTYKQRIATIRTFLEEMKEPELTLELFAEFLQRLEQKHGTASKSTADGYRAAIVHFQKTYNLWTREGTWADTWQCRRVVAGFGYKGRTAQRRPNRGQITAVMFKEMIDYARQHHRRFAPALELAYRAALRPSQLLSLAQGAFTGTHVLVPDKRARSSNNRTTEIYKYVADPQARLLLRGLEKRTGAYFDFSLLQLRTVFKIIAAQLQWPEIHHLTFDGPHCLRHGGMQHCDELLGNESPETREKILQATSSTLLRYTKPNKGRITDTKGPRNHQDEQ